MDLNFLKFEEFNIIADGLNPSYQADQYCQTALNTVPSPYLPRQRTEPLPSASLTFLSGPTPAHFINSLQSPAIGIIEWNDETPDLLQRVAFLAHYQVIGFSVTSMTAAQFKLSQLLCDGIKSHFKASDQAIMAIELTLHEAIINALAHGNLELGSAFQETNDDLQLYYKKVGEKAVDPKFKNRRIDIFAWSIESSILIAIKDDGNGYKWPGPTQAITAPEYDRRKSGRGLDILRQFTHDYWVSEKGNCTVLKLTK